MNLKHALLFAIIATNVSVLMITHKADYDAQVDEETLSQEYERSQYINPDSADWIDDPPLYTYAGLRYIEGQDPSSVNFELQPLTKYVFGLATVWTGNPLFVQVIAYCLLIIGTYVLAEKIIGPSKWTIIPSLLISLDPLSRQHAHIAYLDLMQAVCILIALLGIPKAKPMHMGVVIGLVALSKSFMIGVVVFAVWLTVTLKQIQIVKKTLVTAGAAIATYLIGYSMFFLNHRSFVDFINLHIDIIKLYKSYVPEYPKGEVLRIIYTGLWRKWYGDFGLAVVDQWWIFWPISTTVAILGFFRKKPRKPHESAVILFMIMYALIIGTRLIFPRYLLPILPLLYIYATKTIADIKVSDASKT